MKRPPCWPLALALLGSVVAPPALWAQGTLRLEASNERARVTTGGGSAATTWETLRLGIGWVDPARGGCMGAVERQSRAEMADLALQATCYRRLGDWTVAGGLGATPEASFLYRFTIEGHLSRRVAGTVVATAGYRYLEYPAVSIHQPQPALTWYHRRGEVEGRLFLTLNPDRDRTSATLLLRALQDVSGRVRLGGGVSYGDRIFDIASLPEVDQRAWQAHGWVRFGLTPRDFLVVGGALAHERPDFDLKSWLVAYRRGF